MINLKAKRQHANCACIKTATTTKYFFADFLSTDFWQQLLTANKPAMKKFLKKSVVRSGL